MNRDTQLIFEAYRKRQLELLTERDIGAEFGPSLGAVSSGISEREKSADTYIFKLLKSKNPDKSHDEIVKMVVEPLYNAIFIDNKFSAEGSHKDQLAKLQTALENELAKSYPKAQSSYTARIIKNFLTPVVKILDAEAGDIEGGKEAVNAVKQAVTKAAAKNEVKAPEGEVAAAVKAPALTTFTTSGIYEVKTSDEVQKEGIKLPEDLDRIFTRLQGLEGRDDVTGSELIEELKNRGTEPTKITRFLSDLVRAGVIIKPVNVAGPSSDEGVAGSDKYQDREEMEKHRGAGDSTLRVKQSPFKGTAGDSMFG